LLLILVTLDRSINQT